MPSAILAHSRHHLCSQLCQTLPSHTGETGTTGCSTALPIEDLAWARSLSLSWTASLLFARTGARWLMQIQKKTFASDSAVDGSDTRSLKFRISKPNLWNQNFALVQTVKDHMLNWPLVPLGKPVEEGLPVTCCMDCQSGEVGAKHQHERGTTISNNMKSHHHNHHQHHLHHQHH